MSALDAKGSTIWTAGAYRDDESGLFRERMKSWLRFWNWNGRFVSTFDSNLVLRHWFSLARFNRPSPVSVFSPHAKFRQYLSKTIRYFG